MAQVKILEEGSLFKVVDATTGFPVLPSFYRTLRGARQAATKSGHSYKEAASPAPASQEAIIAEAVRAALAAHGIKTGEPAPKSASKEAAPKPAKTWETSTAYKLGYSKEDCLAVFDFILARINAGTHDWKEAARELIAGGHTEEGVWSAFRAAKAMRAAARAAKKEAAPARKSIPRVVDPGILAGVAATTPATAPAVAPTHTPEKEGIDPLSEVRNALARANGFQRYRAVRRAAERGDARARAVLTTIQAAMKMHERSCRGLDAPAIAAKNREFLALMGIAA